MVLADLGKQISGALRKLGKATVIDEAVLDECLKEISTALLQADVNVRYVAELRKNIKRTVDLEELAAPGSNKQRVIQKAVVNQLVEMLSPDKEPYKPKKGQPNVIMFVGLQGSGKTTSCTKYAHYYQRKGWRVALVCADTFRAGAFDQLKQNATKVKIPFYGSYVESDPVKIAKEGVDLFKMDKYDIIIVDTSGRHRQEAALFDEMTQVAKAVNPDEIVFVMDSHIGQACFEQAKAFKDTVSVGSVVVTKLDGHAKGGGALSAVAATDSPIIFIGTGEHFDEFEPFDAQSFVQRLLGLGDIKGLMSTIGEAMPLDKQGDLMARMQSGQFSLRDLREQFGTVMRMGPLSKVMSMIPGMQSSMLPPGAEQEGVKKMKAYLTMMDSMTDKELDGDQDFCGSHSRILRVARGSGHAVGEVETLVEEYRKYSKMVSKMGKMKLGDPRTMQQMMRNPNQMMQNMGKMIDPKMLKQMGGQGGLMNMMKGLGGAGGGGGGMQGMMEQMGGMEGMQDMMRNMGMDPSKMASMMGKGRGGRRR
ncbi:signal recognition particle 54 kDa protein 2 [Perkinsus marinus ATCC 50983]|uniref:Signal recognition particle 54 kDa protein n=1 Tax=Perkinsus marinus (strain ATCC 50983 / TXsc) TaxID=423536 RepID=C5KB28_PERM5|nr:signal recognition particle 54 kDa protein 2 [Perkinsus marinus ATCC 50983]EER18354.1 signal recognition particle 54 kDa protein 2 [Perkinsus marinus ATCC 50983]|eukprot:XP_002786558.1 signal recognition particle 54 kDa protein 2 [Perkinsus marinus ATCC 50983]